MTTTKKDIENVAAWAELITDIINPASSKESKLAILEAAKSEIEKEPEQFTITHFDACELAWPNLKAIERLESLTIQRLVRHITNNNSAKDASKILFSQQKHGSGSGLLADYLRDLTWKKAV